MSENGKWLQEWPRVTRADDPNAPPVLFNTRPVNPTLATGEEPVRRVIDSRAKLPRRYTHTPQHLPEA